MRVTLETPTELVIHRANMNVPWQSIEVVHNRWLRERGLACVNGNLADGLVFEGRQPDAPTMYAASWRSEVEVWSSGSIDSGRGIHAWKSLPSGKPSTERFDGYRRYQWVTAWWLGLWGVVSTVRTLQMSGRAKTPVCRPLDVVSPELYRLAGKMPTPMSPAQLTRLVELHLLTEDIHALDSLWRACGFTLPFFEAVVAVVDRALDYPSANSQWPVSIRSRVARRQERAEFAHDARTHSSA